MKVSTSLTVATLCSMLQSATLVSSTPTDLTKKFSVDNIKIVTDASKYRCRRAGVHCIHVVDDESAYAVNAVESATAICEMERESAGSGKFAGPIIRTGKCRVRHPGTFVIECVKTGFKSYVSVSFQDDTSTLTAVGDAEAKFKDSKSNTDYDFSKQATAHVPGVDVYVKCPQ